MLESSSGTGLAHRLIKCCTPYSAIKKPFLLRLRISFNNEWTNTNKTSPSVNDDAYI